MPKVPKKTAKATGRGGPLARSSGNMSKKPSGQSCYPTCVTCHILGCTISALVHDVSCTPILYVRRLIFLISRRIRSPSIPI
jgi:hypothetical protein